MQYLSKRQRDVNKLHGNLSSPGTLIALHLSERKFFVCLVLDTFTFIYIYDLEKNAGCFRITAFYLHLYKVGRLVRHIKNKTQWFKSIQEKWSAPKTLAYALYTILLLGLVKLCARRNTDFPSKLEPL